MTEEPVGYSQWGRQELDMTEWAHALHIKHLLFTCYLFLSFSPPLTQLSVETSGIQKLSHIL